MSAGLNNDKFCLKSNLCMCWPFSQHAFSALLGSLYNLNDYEYTILENLEEPHPHSFIKII